jgi:hypothetical protein
VEGDVGSEVAYCILHIAAFAPGKLTEIAKERRRHTIILWQDARRVSHNDAVEYTPTTTTVIEVDGFASLEVLQGELRQEGEEVVHGEEWRLGWVVRLHARILCCRR